MSVSARYEHYIATVVERASEGSDIPKPESFRKELFEELEPDFNPDSDSLTRNQNRLCFDLVGELSQDFHPTKKRRAQRVLIYGDSKGLDSRTSFARAATVFALSHLGLMSKRRVSQTPNSPYHVFSNVSSLFPPKLGVIRRGSKLDSINRRINAHVFDEISGELEEDELRLEEERRLISEAADRIFDDLVRELAIELGSRA